MRVLVAVASRHGSTAEIAARMSAVLREALSDRDPHAVVDLRPVVAVRDLKSYDAVVIGSALYLGHWLRPARRFVREHAAELRARPVWLFSSGPVGEASSGSPDVELGVTELFGAREHHVFAGRLLRAELGVAELLAVRAAHADEGDFRDWADIDSWARGIAADLTAVALV
jgi:menaquinone-dependent protoporphyrinogen oxidase